jgi:hypothetical protein
MQRQSREMPNLEKAVAISSIGTFVLTIVMVALMVIPMLPHPDSQHVNAVSGGKPMIGWLMPSILALSLVLAGVLHFLAARTPKLRSLELCVGAGGLALGNRQGWLWTRWRDGIG